MGGRAPLFLKDQLAAFLGLEAALAAGATRLPGGRILKEAALKALGPVGEAQRAVLGQHPDGEGYGLQHRLQLALELPELALQGLVAGLQVLRSGGECLEGLQELARIWMGLGACHCCTG